MTSFDVTWKSDTKLTGKVFARKRKPKIENKSINVSPQKKPDTLQKGKINKLEKRLKVKHKVIKPVSSENNEHQQKITFDENSVNIKSSKLVKRKQKKDKLLAKLAANGDNQSTPSQIPKQKEHSLFSVGNKDVYVKANAKGKSVVEEVFSASKKFTDLNIHKYIVSNLEKIGYTTLMNVQEKSIPVILSGQNVLVSEHQIPPNVLFFCDVCMF